MRINPGPAKYWGERIYYYSSVTSTNELAKEHANAREGEGSCIRAETQVRGRGRREREWFSPQGGLWFSLILRPAAVDLDGITLLFALWIIEFLEEMTGQSFEIYWPNDIYLRGNKMGGILTEGKSRETGLEWLIVGTGLNINNREFPPDLAATSLTIETGVTYCLDELLKNLLSTLEREYHQYLESGFSLYLPGIIKRCPLIGRKIEIEYYGGKKIVKATGIGDKGELIILKEDQATEEICSAERVLLMD